MKKISLEREKNKEAIGETNGTYIYSVFFLSLFSLSKQANISNNIFDIGSVMAYVHV